MMKINALLIICLIFMCNCSNDKSKNSKIASISDNKTISIDSFEKKIKSDSLRIYELKELEKEIQAMKDKGVIGKWRCDFAGYESLILIMRKDNKYTSEIDFTKSNMKTKYEILSKQGKKYKVKGSEAGEYYEIDEKGNLKMYDDQGLFSNAQNITPGTEMIELPKLDIENVIGQNIFTIAGSYSKSFPQTLESTTAKKWVVYYDDLDVIFEVDKSNDKIIKATIKE